MHMRAERWEKAVAGWLFFPSSVLSVPIPHHHISWIKSTGREHCTVAYRASEKNCALFLSLSLSLSCAGNSRPPLYCFCLLSFPFLGCLLLDLFFHCVAPILTLPLSLSPVADFFEAFKSFENCTDSRSVDCLKFSRFPSRHVTLLVCFGASSSTFC